MINHVIDLCNSLIKSIELTKEPTGYLTHEKTKYENLDNTQWSKILFSELSKIEIKHIYPESRYNFIVFRKYIEIFSTVPNESNNYCIEIKNITEKLIEILMHNFSNNITSPKRKFEFISDDELRKIISRDYEELNSILIPDRAWKSSVVIAGSILEAILLSIIKQEKIPVKKDMSTLTLHELINLAEKHNILPAERIKTIDQVMRDYRNFIHPTKELKAKHQCTEAEAFMSKGCLDGICNYLESQ